MKNTLLMKTEASHSLNFLVYIQNIFLNRSQSRDKLKFPYISTKCEFREDFDLRYRELWYEVSKRICEHPINDLKIFTEEKNLFYQSLFAEKNDTLNVFNEIDQSFKIWWDSFAGRFSVERSIDIYGEKIYTELANLLMKKGIKPQKELNIILIYDDCLLIDLEQTPYFAVLSIKDFVKSRELIAKLQLIIY
jgi:L-rhamnose mutarotase